MLPPWAAPEELTVRSGETTPLNTHPVELLTAPDWNRLCPATLTSYQRTSVVVDPCATVCAVQTAVAPPWFGSTADTAWVNRPSSASSVSLVPFWCAGLAVGSP